MLIANDGNSYCGRESLGEEALRWVRGGRCAVRCSRQRLCPWCVGHGGHRALRIQQVILARSQAQLDQRARVGNGLALPAVVRLIAAHGLFAGLVPRAGGFSAHVVLADQRFLNCLRPLGVDFLLAARLRRLLLRGMLSRCSVRRTGCLVPVDAVDVVAVLL